MCKILNVDIIQSQQLEIKYIHSSSITSLTDLDLFYENLAFTFCSHDLYLLPEMVSTTAGASKPILTLYLTMPLCRKENGVCVFAASAVQSRDRIQY